MKRLLFRDRWVLVTGASSGLGRAMASLLAREHGAHIIPVARRADRLDALKQELESAAHVQVAPIEADLARMEDVDRVVREATKGRALAGAILNAGVTHFGPYEELAWKDFETMLDTNVRGTVRMATQLLPKLENAQEPGGLMIVSSASGGLFPVPYQTAYSATKAFLRTYGECLCYELEGRPVSVTTYAPGGIATEQTAGERFRPLRGWLMDVDRAAQEGVEAFRRRRRVHVPGVVYGLGGSAVGVLPRRLVVGGIAAVYRGALKKAST
jgi:short-subunit dehydrogenase